jgi:hypothetical protein
MIVAIVSMLITIRVDTRSLNNVNRNAKSNATCHFDSVATKYSEFLNSADNALLLTILHDTEFTLTD